MLTYGQLMQPKTVEEAYELYKKNKMAIFLAGGCWTRLGSRTWPSVIDLSGLDLRYIKEVEDYFAIGAMATQWDVECYEPFKTFANGLLVKAVKPILGVQFRNTATMGGSVASKFGFSDIIPTLVALQAQVVLHNEGVISIEEYLSKFVRDLLVEIRIPKKNIPVAVETHRKSASDFPFLTGSINKTEEGYHIYIGGRPGPVMLAKEASQLLTEKGESALEEVAKKAVEEILFQANSHASIEYRKAIAEVMVKHLVTEVLAWK